MPPIHPDQIKAVEAVLRPYITDPAVLVFAAFMEAVNAFDAAAPTRKASMSRDEPDGFAAFYAAYPRRQARRDAASAYRAALARAPAGIILDGAIQYSQMMKGTDPKYIKLPATWLRADCWKDEQPKLTIAAAAFEPASIEGWLKRLEMFMGRNGSDRGTWRAAWGPKPGEDGCLVPEAARVRYYEIYPRRTG